MIAVIMQPTYLPWTGYFDLMDTADVFVILDTVQFEKQAWQQRNRIKVGKDEAKWLTVPVVQELGQLISAVRTEPGNPWRRKHWGTIEQFYRKAPYWKEYSPGLAAIYAAPGDSLMQMNIALITFLKEQLGIKTPLVMASTLPVSGEKVSLLTDMCHHLNANVYVSPVRAADYIEKDNTFAAQGITLHYHRYEHPAYAQQFEGFLPFMSVIDLLFNEGPRSLGIIRSGRGTYEPPLPPRQERL